MLKSQPTPLTGNALLRKINEFSHLSRRETARRCGYYSLKSGQAKVNLAQFYNAVLAARGVSLEPGSKKDRRGCEPTFRVRVRIDGEIVIGSTYIEQMRLKPGDQLELKLGRKHIHLKQVEAADESKEQDY